MRRRSILSAAERESLPAVPDAEDELIRHNTFSESDLSLIRHWLHYGGHAVAPIRRSRSGSITSVGDTCVSVDAPAHEHVGRRGYAAGDKHLSAHEHASNLIVVRINVLRDRELAFGDADALICWCRL